MKFQISQVAMLAVCALACCGKVIEEEKHEDKRQVATALAVAAVVTSVMSSLAGFIRGLNGPKNVKDTVVTGRAIRIVVNDDKGCASVTDRDTGYKSTKCASSSTEATALATEELITLLIKLGQISQDDLHLRPKPVTRPPTLCKDQLSTVKCQKHIGEGHCDIGSTFFHWMHENCFRSCAGCKTLEEIFPNNQNSAVGR
ncbi:uncharacterized protein [Watersipora subatra]|uniref:uncharacterized protein n=1 Tax=Watersipora subatra TaxID=2589382 RepID=UPI00355C1557